MLLRVEAALMRIDSSSLHVYTQCKGGDSVAGASWMNLNGTAGQVVLPLLGMLASPDQPQRSDRTLMLAAFSEALPDMDEQWHKLPSKYLC